MLTDTFLIPEVPFVSMMKNQYGKEPELAMSVSVLQHAPSRLDTNWKRKTYEQTTWGCHMMVEWEGLRKAGIKSKCKTQGGVQGWIMDRWKRQQDLTKEKSVEEHRYSNMQYSTSIMESYPACWQKIHVR